MVLVHFDVGLHAPEASHDDIFDSVGITVVTVARPAATANLPQHPIHSLRHLVEAGSQLTENLQRREGYRPGIFRDIAKQARWRRKQNDITGYTMSGPPLSSLTFAQLQPLINANNETVDDRTPKDWFERAVRESELSVLAARKQRKEEMFLCYTKACQYYMNARMHPDFGAVKKSDPNWGTRVKDFKEVSELAVPPRILDANGLDIRGIFG
jgi:hypothetical protein